MLRITLIGLIAILCLACADQKETELELRGAELERDYQNWMSSFREDIDLSSEFVALGPSGEEISREEFIQELRSGRYIPITSGQNNTYGLYELSPEADDQISLKIKETANRVYDAFEPRADTLPDLENSGSSQGFEEYAEQRESLPPPPSSSQPTGRSGATTTLADTLP